MALNFTRVIATVVLVTLCGAWTESSSASTRTRIVTGNISSGKKQSYDPGEGIRIFKGLKADIALIQELNYKDNSDAAMNEFVEQGFSKDFHLCRDTEKDHSIPNGIVSRYPIRECGLIPSSTQQNRDYVYARIDIPGERDMWVISVHLSHSVSSNRIIEATEIVDHIKGKIPASDFLLIGGDFNTRSRGEPAMKKFAEIFVDSHVPKGAEGKEGTNSSRKDPYDYVLPNAALEKLHTPVQIENTTFNDGLVFDSRTFSQLDLVKPILKGDSGVTGMQHMAVVKDFLLPE